MERVGILLVHGVGEQKRFEHLEGELRQIVQSLSNDPTVDKVSVTTRSSLDSAYLAEQLTWKAEDGAPVRVQVALKSGDTRVLEFREVWWADIDERNTLSNQVKFWFWGLGQWAVAGYDTNTHNISDFVKMKLPAPASGKHSLRAWLSIRAKLFFVALFFCLVMLTLSLINFVLARFLKGRLPGPDIIVSYVGDVKLLVQDKREGRGPIYDLGLPPRASVRRRIVSALVEMAMSDYDRWYVAAHSLGTVVAFNGLMETQLALPNYLDENKWNQCSNHRITDTAGNDMGPLAGPGEQETAAGKKMMPRRPAWLKDDDVIHRDRLFSRLHGFLTYGSPLDKFSALWSGIVGINQSAAFIPEFEWINVFDETDPVSGPLDDYGTPSETTGQPVRINAKPRNFAFSAGPVLLLSHLKYLSYKSNDNGRLVNRLSNWFVSGGAFPAPKSDSPTPEWQEGGLRWGRYLGHLAQWAIVFAVLAAIFGWVLSKLSMLLSTSFESVNLPTVDGLWEWMLLGLLASLAIVIATGVLRLLGAHKLGS